MSRLHEPLRDVVFKLKLIWLILTGVDCRKTISTSNRSRDLLAKKVGPDKALVNTFPFPTTWKRLDGFERTLRENGFWLHRERLILERDYLLSGKAWDSLKVDVGERSGSFYAKKRG